MFTEDELGLFSTLMRFDKFVGVKIFDKYAAVLDVFSKFANVERFDMDGLNKKDEFEFSSRFDRLDKAAASKMNAALDALDGSLSAARVLDAQFQLLIE